MEALINSTLTTYQKSVGVFIRRQDIVTSTNDKQRATINASNTPYDANIQVENFGESDSSHSVTTSCTSSVDDENLTKYSDNKQFK